MRSSLIPEGFVMTINPFYAAHETSLSRLPEHDWQILRNRSHRGINWTVEKLGRRWLVQGCFGNFPSYRTKHEAGEMIDNLIIAESHHRAKLQWDAENSA